LSLEHPETAAVAVVWEGNSLEVVRSFPGPVRQDLGAELRRLQIGDRPLNSRPMPSIGARVYELKEQDERSWYGVIYLAKNRESHSRAPLVREKIGQNRKERFSACKGEIETSPGKACGGKMKARAQERKPTHISRGNVIDDLGFSPEEAAAIKLKASLQAEIMRIVEKKKLRSRQLEIILISLNPESANF
jgi:hypothetical protein